MCYDLLEVKNMADYQEMYLTLFRAATKAIDLLDRKGNKRKYGPGGAQLRRETVGRTFFLCLDTGGSINRGDRVESRGRRKGLRPPSV